MAQLLQDNTKAAPNNKISRHTSSPGNQQKVTWMANTLKGYGLAASLQSFRGEDETVSNVIGTVRGPTTKALYTLSAHIDSISDSGGLAPGANDDGSGIVVIMEAARILNSYKACMKSDVDIVGFNDEENSMNGGPAYIKSISSRNYKGGWNLDMVGIADGTPCMANNYNSSKDQFLANKITSVKSVYGINIELNNGTYSEEDVDAASFWAASLPKGYLVECADDPDYHSPNDLADNLSFSQLELTTKLIVAATAELASQ